MKIPLNETGVAIFETGDSPGSSTITDSPLLRMSSRGPPIANSATSSRSRPSAITAEARTPRSAKTAQTRERLIAAALAQFNAVGYFGTDSNQIARAAGFAPQTFYRHFADKTEIFLEAYERWWRTETAAIQELSKKSSFTAKAAAQVALAFHARCKIFRRSLRLLTAQDDRVRAARALARHAQIEALDPALSAERVIAEKLGQLLTLERQCDAAAAGEFLAFGLSERQVLELVTAAMERYLERTG